MIFQTIYPFENVPVPTKNRVNSETNHRVPSTTSIQKLNEFEDFQNTCRKCSLESLNATKCACVAA